MSSSKIVSVAAKAASFNIIYQLTSRVATFVLNAFILRYVTKDVLGVINVRLLLLYTTVQFISREPFRRTCTSEAKSRHWSSVNNFIWLSLPMSVVFSTAFSIIWLKLLHHPNPAEMPGYEFAVIGVVCSVVIEMFAEPLYNYGQLNGYVKLRVVAEGGALLLRCVVMAIFVRHHSRDSLYIFATAQLLSAVFYVALYWTYFSFHSHDEHEAIKSVKEFLPKFARDKSKQPLLDRSLLLLSSSFLKQTIVKQLLTEGEKFVMTFFNPLTFSEQGVYDLVNNLGSLAARFVLQPIEESAYMVFSQFLAREKRPEDQKPDAMRTCREVLVNVLKTMIIVGLFIVAFGYNFSELALLIYAGPTFAEGLGPNLLRWQCLYTLIIAVNGITECFTFAAMNKRQLDNFNWTLGVMSVVFLTSAYLLTIRMGSQGFVVANCINMAGRILFSLHFIRRYFQESKEPSPLRESMPRSFLVVLFATAFAVLRFTEVRWCCNSLSASILHLSCGTFLFFAVVLATVLIEKDLRAFYVTYGKIKKA